MKTNRYVTKRFMYAMAALAAEIVGQLLLSTGELFLAILLSVIAVGFFVFALHNQPGPTVSLTSYPSFRNDWRAQWDNLLRTISHINYGAIYWNLRRAIKPLFRSILAWLVQNRLVISLFVLVVGVAGQYLLLADQLLIGAIITAVATLLFVMIVGKHSGPDAELNIEPFVQKSIDPKWSWWGRISLGLAILFAGLAFWLFGTSIPAILPWLLHLSSIGLLILSSVWMNKFNAPVKTLDNHGNSRAGWTLLEIGIFIAILAIAAFMRLYRFDQIPFGLWYDEADNGLNALKILNTPGFLPVYAESTNLPAHFIYIIVLFFRLFGVSTLSIRAGSVVFGLATVVAAFFAGQELFDRKIGLVLAFFLAVSRWDINWSRIGMHGITVPFFELLSVGLILRALRKQRLIDYCLAGLSIGFGLCFYTPLRLFPIVICVLLLFLLVRRLDLIRTVWRWSPLLLLSIFIASVPVSEYAVSQPDTFFNRMQVTSIFTGKSFQDGWKAVAQTTREHLLMFNYHGDNNGRHNLPGAPMLDPISGTLFILGVGLSLWRIRQPGSFLLIAWLLIMLMPGIFSLDFESPQSLRAIGSLPAAYLLAVVPIHSLWQEWNQSSGKYRTFVFSLLLVLVLIGVGYINYHIYFDLQAENSDTWSAFSTPETIIGKTMAELGPQADNYVSVFYNNTPTIRFLAPNNTDYHILNTYDTLPIPTDGKKTVVFFVDGDRKPFFLQAQHYYPDANFKEYKTPDGGTTVLYQITLKPSDIAASEGVTVSYYHNANWSEQPFLVQNEPDIDTDWKDGNPAQFPFGVKWQGVVYADTYGLYRFAVYSPAPSELYIDNVQINLAGEGVQTGEIELAKGSHELILETLGKEGHFELDWQPPDQKEAPIPSSNLFLPPISNNGLLGKYYPNGAWQAPSAFTEVDSWIHFYYQEQPLPSPFTVEWVGKINITKGGHYAFGLESIDESVLFIDGVQLVSAPEANKLEEGEIDLTPGFHSIDLRYANRTGYAHINIYWAPPDSDREIIPQEVLFLP